MNREKVKLIAKYFKPRTIREGDDYVMFNCPFAKKLHKHGRDKHPSFSISVGNNSSVYHCFSCGVKGKLRNLPASLFKVYGGKYTTLQKFINKYENIDLLVEPKKENSIIEVIDSYVLDAFKDLEEDWRYVKVKTAKLYSIKEYLGTIIIPYFTMNKELVALKYRENRAFTTDGKFKEAGVFFGMHLPLNPKLPLYIVEGERDVMLLKQIGIHNVWGVSGQPSKAQIETLKSIPNPLVLFLDNDEGGYKFFDMIVSKVLNLTDVWYITNYFNCKDPAELYEKGLLKQALSSKKRWISELNFFT